MEKKKDKGLTDEQLVAKYGDIKTDPDFIKVLNQSIIPSKNKNNASK